MFQSHKAEFLCNDGLGHPGQFVYIRDDREEEEYFGLCEVQVFAFRGKEAFRSCRYLPSEVRKPSGVAGIRLQR